MSQGGHIKINLKSEIPVQVDGEPWVAAPSEVVVLKSALKVCDTTGSTGGLMIHPKGLYITHKLQSPEAGGLRLPLSVLIVVVCKCVRISCTI